MSSGKRRKHIHLFYPEKSEYYVSLITAKHKRKKRIGSLPLSAKLPISYHYKKNIYKSIAKIITTITSVHNIQRIRFTRLGRSR